MSRPRLSAGRAQPCGRGSVIAGTGLSQPCVQPTTLSSQALPAAARTPKEPTVSKAPKVSRNGPSNRTVVHTDPRPEASRVREETREGRSPRKTLAHASPNRAGSKRTVRKSAFWAPFVMFYGPIAVNDLPPQAGSGAIGPLAVRGGMELHSSRADPIRSRCSPPSVVERRAPALPHKALCFISENTLRVWRTTGSWYR